MTRGDNMPSFEEEAFTRAQQMHRRPPYRREATQNKDVPQAEKNNINEDTLKDEKSKSEPAGTNNRHESLLDIMFKNKEQSLILLLIILLMEENTEPSLLLALMYLLL